MGVIMEINNENILKIAIQQSAVDAGCLAEDFLREEEFFPLFTQCIPPLIRVQFLKITGM